MPTYPGTEAHKHVKDSMQADFKKALADAANDGKEIYEVMVVNGVPVIYSIRDKTT